MATTITLTWDQPLGADAVESFVITYSYDVRECINDGENTPLQPVSVTIGNGSQRSYTIMNSSETPVEEDSQYSISMRAVNSVGMSAQSNTAMTTTASAGECLLISVS